MAKKNLGIPPTQNCPELAGFVPGRIRTGSAVLVKTIVIGILLSTSIAKVLLIFMQPPVVQLPDPVIPLKTFNVIIISSLAELAIAGILLARFWGKIGPTFLLGFSLVSLSYHFVAILSGATSSCPCLGIAVKAFQITPYQARIISISLAAALATGSIFLINKENIKSLYNADGKQ